MVALEILVQAKARDGLGRVGGPGVSQCQDLTVWRGAVWPSFLPFLSRVQPFMFFLRKSMYSVIAACQTPLPTGPRVQVPRAFPGRAVPTETVWERLCSFWLSGVVSPQPFHATAHVGNGFSQESQKACDLALPA